MEKKITKTLDKATAALEKLEKSVQKYSEGPKKIVTDVIDFLKAHKKLLVVLGVGYLLFDLLLSDTSEDSDE